MKCPHCNTTCEVVTHPESEFYTSGITQMCDCGFTTVKPKLTYTAFCERLDLLRSAKREVARNSIDNMRKVEKSRYYAQSYTFNRLWKFQETLNRDEDHIDRQLAKLCNAFNAYSHRYYSGDRA